MSQSFSGLPFDLTPSPGSDWVLDPKADTITVRSAPNSDIYSDPGGDAQVSSTSLHNAVTLMAPAPSGDFSLSALVQVDFSGTFDAGSLFMRIDERFWAKLCFEFSPDREAMIVSVVNKEVSDDANGFTVEADRAHLRISRIGQAYAFHASTDGTTWRLIRAFALGRAHDALEIGFEAQSPHTQGCQVTFHNPTFHGAGLADLRDGS